MPYSHGRRRKSRTHNDEMTSNISSEIPTSMVVRHGHLTSLAKQLVIDLRQTMEPYSVKKVRESATSKLKDYVSLATHMGLSHLQMISQTENGLYLKLIRLPSGSTLTFRIIQFTLSKDLRSSQKKPRTSISDFSSSPLLVLNGFKCKVNQNQPKMPPVQNKTSTSSQNEYTYTQQLLNKLQNNSSLKQQNQKQEDAENENEEDLKSQEEENQHQNFLTKDQLNNDFFPYKPTFKTHNKNTQNEISKIPLSNTQIQQANQLITTFLSNMYPAIDVHTIKLKNCKRIVLYNYNEENEKIEVRNYAILKRPAGLTRGVKKIIYPSLSSSSMKKSSSSLNMKNVSDLADFIISGGPSVQSDSEVDDSTVYDISNLNAHNNSNNKYTQTQQIAISLIELGPRLTLEFVKAEEEICSGQVLFHRYIKKTDEEIIEIEKRAPFLKKQRSKDLKYHEKKMAKKVKDIEYNYKKERNEKIDKQDEIEDKIDENDQISSNVMAGQDDIKDLPESTKTKEKYHPFSFKKKKNNKFTNKKMSNFKTKYSNSHTANRHSVLSKYHASKKF